MPAKTRIATRTGRTGLDVDTEDPLRTSALRRTGDPDLLQALARFGSARDSNWRGSALTGHSKDSGEGPEFGAQRSQ